MNRIPFLAAFLWCLAIVAAPLLGLSAVYAFFSAICHQDPARSWFIAGEPLPVCIRCASIYMGFLAALFAGLEPSARWLRAAILIAITEFVIARLFLDSAITRSLSGILLGATAAPFVNQGVLELLELLRRRKVRESV